MLHSSFLVLALILANLLASSPANAQTQLAKSPKVLSAKTICFDDRTGEIAVVNAALAQLKKWGRFQIVQDKKLADIIFLFSADPYNGGYVLLASGQTGTVGENGHIKEDRVPNYNLQPPVRHAYLTLIDPETGQNLWSDSHVWGGLLTGPSSAGERLIKKLQKQIEK